MKDVAAAAATGCTVSVTSCQTEPVMVGSVVRHRLVLVGSAVGAVTATGSDDTRTVMAIVVLLAVVGVGLAMLAMWVFRVTRPDRGLLAPLEVMGDRTWRRGDPVWQRRRLDEVRPADAAPFRPAAAPPAIDESYDAGPTAPGFEDLNDPADDGDDSHAAPALPLAPAEEIDDEDITVATGVPTEGDAAADANSGSGGGAESEVSADADADGDRSLRNDATIGVDEAEGAGNADVTGDSGASGAATSLSDDVSSTPRDGVTRLEFVDASPSADPDATLADLVATAEERPASDDGSDDPIRSGE